MKNILRVLLIAGFFVAQMSPAFADDSDIFGRNVQPNVMILFDSSGSMADEVPSQPYDPATTYPTINKCGNPATSACDPVKVYKLSSGKYTVYANTVALVNKLQCQDCIERQRFLVGKHQRDQLRSVSGQLPELEIVGQLPRNRTENRYCQARHHEFAQ